MIKVPFIFMVEVIYITSQVIIVKFKLSEYLLASTFTKSSITADNTASREDLTLQGCTNLAVHVRISCQTGIKPTKRDTQHNPTLLRIKPKEPRAIERTANQAPRRKGDPHSTLKTCLPKCRLQKLPPWRQGFAPAYACGKWKTRTK